MLAIGLVLNIAVVGLFCWALFSLSVYALPFFVAVSIGLAALHHGFGIGGALLAGTAAAALTLAACRYAFVVAQSATSRAIVAAFLLVPAAVAGYHTTHALSCLLVLSSSQQEVCAWLGAASVCWIAWNRLALFTAPSVVDRAGHDPSQPVLTNSISNG